MSAEHDLQQLRERLQVARSDRERLTRAVVAGQRVVDSEHAMLVALMTCREGFDNRRTAHGECDAAMANLGGVLADLARSVSESAKEEPSDAAISRVGERIDAQQHRIQELESLVAKSPESGDVRGDAHLMVAIATGLLPDVRADAEDDAWHLTTERIDFAPIWNRADFERRLADEGYARIARLPQEADPADFRRSLPESATKPVTRGPVSGAGGNT